MGTKHVLRTSLGVISAFSSAGCLSTGASGYQLSSISNPSYGITGQMFSNDSKFGFYKLNSTEVYTLTSDTISVKAYSDSSCSTAASGSFTISNPSSATDKGVATFSGISYSWPVSGYEGSLYLQANTTKTGLSLCYGPIYIVQNFGGGKCYTASCAGPGLSGAAAAQFSDRGNSIMQDSDGKLVVLGFTHPSGLGASQYAQGAWRMKSNGTTDTTYVGPLVNDVAGGNAGNFSDKMWEAAKDSSGRYVAGGESWTGAGAVRIAAFRLTSGLAADTTFNSGSYFFVAGSNFAGGTFDQARAMALDSQGRIVLGGASNNAAGGSQWTVWRLSTSGGVVALDTNFNSGNGAHTWGNPAPAGMNVNASIIDGILGMTVDSSDRIVAVGVSRNTSNGLAATVTRYTSAGIPDSSFGASGAFVQATSFTGNTLAAMDDRNYGVAVDSSGRIVVAGRSKNSSNGMQAYVFRLTSAGALDTSFGTNGVLLMGYPGAAGAALVSTVNDNPQRMKIDSSGRIVLAGYSKDASNFYHATVWRITSSGALDTTFNSVGYANTNLSLGGQGEFAMGLNIDQIGRIAITGYAAQVSGSDMAIWRFWSDGSPDQ